MIDRIKYDLTKSAPSSIYRHLPPGRTHAEAVATKSGAGKGGIVPESLGGEHAATSPAVNEPDVRGSAGRPAGIPCFSPGKQPDVRDGEVSSVAEYVSAIKGNWRRGVDAFMNIASLCAKAEARLTTAQKSELIHALPFGNTAFSKFVRIGSDSRLYAPEIQVLLPPHYTTLYAVTLLPDGELDRAIAEKVLHPDTTRAQLQNWRNSHREKVVVAPSPKEPSVSDAISLPTAPTQVAVQSGTLASPLRPEQLAVAPDAPAPEAVPTAAEVVRPLTPPRIDDDIPVFLDRRPLSADDQRAFDLIMAALNSASALVRARVRAELVRADAGSGSVAKAVSSRRQEDDASAIRNQPTESAASVYTAEAAERAEVAKSESAGEASPDMIRDAPKHADASIKYGDIQVPGRRKRRRSKKPRGPLESLPF